MSIQHANRGIVKKDLQLYYNREFSKCFRGESTTNLIGTYGAGGVDAYPASGNNWGTYQARGVYNNGAFGSIGTSVSVTSNVATVTSPSSYFNTLATFDVIRPQTTGGGVTANTDYYFKKLSSSTFTLHQWDSTENGSKTPEQILTYINSDTKISINSTSFPTMWWGHPHLPNSALIKTAITNGFAYDNRFHDCLRLNWFRSDAADGMAYGVYPSYTGSTVYTFSAYIRAIDQNAIGKTISLSTYYSGPNVGGPSSTSPVLTTAWQRWTLTFTSNATPGAMIFYFFAGYSPMVVDISEIQFEQKGYATEFAINSRSANTVAGGGGLLDMSGNNLNSDLTNVTFDSTGYIFAGSQYITVPYSSNLDRNDFTIVGYCRTSTNDNSHDTVVSRNSDVYGATNGWNISRLRNGLSLANCFRFMIYGDSSTAVEPQGPAIADNVWRHFAVVVDKSGSNTVTIYINGVAYSTPATLPAGNHYPSSGSPPLYVGCNKTNADLWNGDIPQILYYQKALTAAEVSQNFNATRKTYGI
jgi:hypothetical protein